MLWWKDHQTQGQRGPFLVPPLIIIQTWANVLTWPRPQVVYPGTEKNICPTHHLGLLMTMQLNTICESHLWNVECYINLLLLLERVLLLAFTVPDITRHLVTTCFCCFSNIPRAKSCSVGALWVQAGTVCEAVEKWCLISEKRNVRNLWAAHLQPPFIVPTQWVRFSLKLWSFSANT